MTRSKGRAGRPWRELRQQIIRASDVCGICGKPVDKTLVFPDPQSPSVDHIVPLSLGGHPLRRDNLRLTHLGCNNGRGNRPTVRVVTSREW